MKNFFFIVLIIVLVIQNGCTKEEVSNPFDFQHQDFESRSYILSVPDNYDPENPSPLLFAFHGYSMNANQMQEVTDFDELGKSERFIIVYPNSYYENEYWTDGCNCHGLEAEGIDDVLFVDYLLEKIKKEYSIDESRVYAMGISQGAAFVQHLACRRAEKFAAFSSYIGSMREVVAKYCAPKKPINMIIMNGTADQDSRWDGLQNSPYAFISIPDLFKKWAGFDGCTDSLSTEMLPDKVSHIDVEKITYVDCSSGKELVLCKIINGVHALYRNAEFDFAVESINFFNQYSLNN